jgi:hypothetical protein
MAKGRASSMETWHCVANLTVYWRQRRKAGESDGEERRRGEEKTKKRKEKRAKYRKGDQQVVVRPTVTDSLCKCSRVDECVVYI